GGTSAPATSAQTAVVLPPVPVNTAVPTIPGTAAQGQTLTESHGTWTNSPTSFAYQWQRCDSAGANCAAIAGAANQTYVLVAADMWEERRVREAGTNGGGASSDATTAQTAGV